MLRFVTLACILASSVTLHAATLHVIDGDKVLLNGEPAQLVDIDSPELCQPGGTNARQVLATLLDGALTYEATGSTENGVTLIRLYVDGREVNQTLVQLGWAWDVTQSSHSRYAFAEAVAKTDRIGLWADENPVPPWTWRRLADERDAEGCDQFSWHPATDSNIEHSDVRRQPSVMRSVRIPG